MEYKIFKSSAGPWEVYSGSISYGHFRKEDLVFTSDNITDCYIWIKANREGLIGIE